MYTKLVLGWESKESDGERILETLQGKRICHKVYNNKNHLNTLNYTLPCQKHRTAEHTNIS